MITVYNSALRLPLGDTCHDYRDRLDQLGILCSMGEVGNCYDNAKAERVNGILKIEYGLGDLLLNFKHAELATQQAVWLYNHERPHLALNYQRPVDVHFSNLLHLPGPGHSLSTYFRT